MFGSAIAINEFLIVNFQKIVQDLSEEALFQPGAGHGHPPVWIMGHLAVTGESGQRLLGGSVSHPDWMPLFGPGSTDQIAKTDAMTIPQLATAVTTAYETLRTLAAAADPEAMAHNHRIPLFRGTSIKTVGDCVTLLLTNHFGFHLAQLSSCRRAEGHAPLF